MSDGDRGPQRQIDELMQERERAISEALGDRDYLKQSCTGCGKDMVIGRGDRLFAGRWYHSECWARMGGVALVEAQTSSIKGADSQR